GGRAGELRGGPCRTSGLRRVRRLGCGGTALWHGLYNAVRLKMRRQAGRKTLVVISDGWDTGSDRTLTDVIEAAQGADTSVYTIRWLGPIAWVVPGLSLHGRRSLQRLAGETGGAAFRGSQQGLPDLFARTENERRSQYVLAYTALEKAPHGTFRRLEVTVERPDLTVRARKGYFAP